ncbi:MAG: hypothetical protein K2V38_14255, partial [Gemmataceae bacterium]|nr:hypothetical protein [Gemmataceae bacterium]
MPPNARSWRWLAPLVFPALAILCAISCGPADNPAPSPTSTPATSDEWEPGREWFADVTGDWGLTFTHDPGPTGSYFMPQTMGSGVAVFDCDGDGLLDVYLLNFGGPESKSTNKLFRQVAPGQFQDVTEGS